MIPMLHRPLLDPPDPAERYEPSHGRIWMTPGGRWADVGQWVVNPGEPGEPELLPWKRAG
jgi:hypothetical protein